MLLRGRDRSPSGVRLRPPMVGPDAEDNRRAVEARILDDMASSLAVREGGRRRRR